MKGEASGGEVVTLESETTLWMFYNLLFITPRTS